MEREKLIKIIGGGIGLILLITIASVLTGDDVEPVFRRTIITQNTVMEISDEAASEADDVATRTLAARIGSTTASDRNRLSKIYRAQYGDSIKAVDKSLVTELEETPEGFDALYREQALKLLQRSRRNMEALQAEFAGEEARNMFKKARQNHRAHIKTLREE
ncbi:hypothetical protein BRC19_01580 [Candidatus Saccharibacteria bacterium QS_5_54_17]|nr:MAG: hypothetical protein BRC19_01580 [Candidatus Saccharibacteria bacterium QS_5_54_17]